MNVAEAKASAKMAQVPGRHSSESLQSRVPEELRPILKVLSLRARASAFSVHAELRPAVLGDVGQQFDGGGNARGRGQIYFLSPTASRRLT